MLLYTPLSAEDILNDGYDGVSSERQMVTYQNRQIYAEQLTTGQYELIQLMSTNPNDFLIDEFTPGSHIHFEQVSTVKNI